MRNEEFLSEHQDGADWICIRPEKRYTKLRVSIQSAGAAKLPLLLNPDAQPAMMRCDKIGRVWFSGIPDISLFVARATEDPVWLLDIVEKRAALFQRVRNHINLLTQLRKNWCTQGNEHCVLLQAVREWSQQHTNIYHLILLNALIVDDIGDSFFELLIKCVGNRLALEHITELFRTPYAQQSKRTNAGFHTHTLTSANRDSTITSLIFPELAPKSRLEGEVVNKILSSPLSSRAASWRAYCTLRMVSPLLVQLNDEQAYVWRAQSILMSAILETYEKAEREREPSFRVGELSLQRLIERLQ